MERKRRRIVVSVVAAMSAAVARKLGFYGYCVQSESAPPVVPMIKKKSSDFF